MNTMVDYKIHCQSGQDNSENYYLRSLKYSKYNFKIWNRHSFYGERYANLTGSSFIMLWSEKLLGQIKHYEE